MRARLTLITLIASTLTVTGCRLSDQQQIGMLRFVANSITGAIDESGPVTVAPSSKAGQVPAAAVCIRKDHAELHAFQHVASRVARCHVRVKTIPARVMLTVNIEALRRVLAGETVTVAKKRCPRPAPAVRS